MDQFHGNLAPPVSYFLFLLFRLNSHLEHKASPCLRILPGLLGPKQGGTLHLLSFGRLRGCLWPNVDGASPLFQACCVNQGIQPLFSSIFSTTLFFPNLSLYL